MKYPASMREEELKNRVAQDFFPGMDASRILGNIDFCLTRNIVGANYSLLWAEAKRGNRHDIFESFVQLILTIGRSTAHYRELPPAFLGAFDAEKIAFLPFHLLHDALSQTDFDWTVTPSNHESKEFRQLYTLVRGQIEQGMYLFDYEKDEPRLREFIERSFVKSHGQFRQIEVTKNNFVSVFLVWTAKVRDSISINWENARKAGLLEGDFFLADLLSEDNCTIKDKLYVLLKSNHYEFDRSIDEIIGSVEVRKAAFKDNQKAHAAFWKLYRRPPKEEFWDYIVERRELLVPQDVRERKGAFFTPAQWVELSQRYLTDALGEDWQDEYIVWDCAAGTGNLLAGLVNKYNIYASTLDPADVAVMKDRIQNGANLLEDHVFQFDFLNDSFDSKKIPESLRNIIKNNRGGYGKIY